MIVSLGLLAMAGQSYERTWTKLTVPFAQCGDGSPFNVFLSIKNPRKLAVRLKGGAACWSAITCNRFRSVPNLGEVQSVKEDEGFVSLNPTQSPVHDYTLLYVPYCTGDVYLGRHSAQYGFNRVYHVGRANIENMFRFLKNEKIIDYESLTDLVLQGSSAGAIGALYHINTLAPYVNNVPRKSMLLDAPGLHFGNDFWGKFSYELLTDYSNALSESGLRFNPNKGNVSESVKLTCEKYPDWIIGVMQGAKDRTMSSIFGNINPFDHRKKVMGEDGILKHTERRGDNCSAFVPDSFVHTMVKKIKTLQKQAGGITALEYAYKIVSGHRGKNFHD